MIEILALIAIAVPFAWKYYRTHAENTRIRALVPHAMLEASSARSPQSVIERLSEERNEIGREARKILALSERVGLKRALLAYNGEAMLERFFRMLALWEESGVDYSTAFEEGARSTLSLKALEEKASAAALTHKYTLLAGGALAIPFTLGMMVSASSASGAPESVRETVLLGVEAYVLFYAAIAAYFCSMLEGKAARFPAYVIALAGGATLVLHYAIGK